MMSINNKYNNNMDLTFAFGYSDHTVQKKLNNDSGAGVNAGSGLHIFSASDPLSELVWSPQKGLSLKCAENRLANEKPFLLWNLTPSSEVSAPSDMIRLISINDEKDISKGSTDGTENPNPAKVVGIVDTDENTEHQRMNEEKDLSLIQMTGNDEGGENCAGNGEEQRTEKSLLQVAGPEFDQAVALECDEVAASSYGQNKEIAIASGNRLLGLGVTEALETQPSGNSGPIVASLQMMEFTAENDCKEVSAQNEARLLRNNSAPLEASPVHIRTSPRKRKGKGKALSDSDSRTSSDEESSHESVESCNSTRMFPESKKLKIEEPLFLRCKRFKKQMLRNAATSPTVIHGNSFMTWISNMVNGLSKPSQEEVPSLALALVEGNHYGIAMCDKDHNIGSRNMEIQDMFHPKDDVSGGESKDVFLDDKMIIEVSPLACHRENDGSDEQIFTSNDKFNKSASGNMERVSTRSPIMSQNVASAWEARKSTSAKKGGSSSCSLCIHRTCNGENSSPSHHSENKAIENMSDRTSPQSFWITRFSTPDPCTALNLADCSENRDETTNCPKPSPNVLLSNKGSEAKQSSTEDPGNDMFKNVSCYALNVDASTGFKEDHANNYEKFIHKLNRIIPSPKFRSSEAMTSLFARRLDAFKRIVPPDARNEAICLFCGRRGHNIRNCSEVTESEQEDLRNISSYDWTDNSNIILYRKDKSGIVTHSNNLVQDPESISVERIARSSDVLENIASNSGGNVLKGTSVLPLSTFGIKDTASVPKGTFDAIRRLRLSRGDILKWLNSDASLSYLDGFFLRLRLGRLEGGLGKTGYYIARIAGSQREYSAKDSKKCISVRICGIICSVGSQYVSNHDFLEDELMTWWCKTSECGGQVPSEDELRLIVEKRMKLGF